MHTRPNGVLPLAAGTKKSSKQVAVFDAASSSSGSPEAAAAQAEAPPQLDETLMRDLHDSGVTVDYNRRLPRDNPQML